MKIYKFKDLNDEKKRSHFCQIVSENKIWCAKPDSLNDENEFKFEIDYALSSSTPNLLSQLVLINKYGNTNDPPPHLSVDFVEKYFKPEKLKEIADPIIDDMIEKCRKKIGVVSFSMIKTDVLWNEYGGKGNGVCIEINIPESLIGKSYHLVNYVKEKIFPVDPFLEVPLSKSKGRVPDVFINMLSTKTMRWSPEKEIRFISNRQEVVLPIDGYISEITFGSYVPAHTFKQVEAKIINHCNTNNIKIIKL